MKRMIPLALCLALAACGGTRVVDLNDKDEVNAMQHVMELEYRDWTNTAEKMTNSMINSGALKSESKPVIAMGNIVNDTTQRFDTDVLTKKIRTTLLNSGKAQIATNFSGEDTNSDKMRAQRGNDEYDQKTIAQKGTLVAPNMSLSGKMLQRNLKLESGWFSSVDTRVEYYLQLTLTDLKTGLSVWEDEQPIIKEGKDAPTW
jgi:uncharacterized protein (TIGR02722 family)